MRLLASQLRTGLCALTLLCGAGGTIACDPAEPEDSSAVPDTRLLSHSISEGQPTKAGLSYIDSIAEAHTQADQATDPAKAEEILRAALAIEPPAGLSEAEILRLELGARLGETLLPARPREARELLDPMLLPTRSLPIDRASAHALVVLGDAALAEGDDALAAGSYMRSVRMMSMLREELAP